MMFTIKVSASSPSQGAVWFFRGAIKKESINASTTLYGPTTEYGGVGWNTLSGGTVNISADTTNGALKILVTGQIATNVMWHAVVECAETQYI
jgi:hypothetical protein